MKTTTLLVIISIVWIKLMIMTTATSPITISLPPLPYEYNALEPMIDEETMRIHHTKHHQAYITKYQQAINDLIASNNGNNEWKNYFTQKSLLTILRQLDTIPVEYRTIVRNNGGGHYNHDMFWKILQEKRQDNLPPSDSNILKSIVSSFGTFDAFKQEFNKNALALFGSGWTFVTATCDKNGGDVIKINIENLPNQDVPQVNIPVYGIDLFEHAYYLKYRNNRNQYVDNIWSILNWEQIEKNLLNACHNVENYTHLNSQQ